MCENAESANEFQADIVWFRRRALLWGVLWAAFVAASYLKPAGFAPALVGGLGASLGLALIGLAIPLVLMRIAASHPPWLKPELFSDPLLGICAPLCLDALHAGLAYMAGYCAGISYAPRLWVNAAGRLPSANRPRQADRELPRRELESSGKEFNVIWDVTFASGFFAAFYRPRAISGVSLAVWTGVLTAVMLAAAVCVLIRKRSGVPYWFAHHILFGCAVIAAADGLARYLLRA